MQAGVNTQGLTLIIKQNGEGTQNSSAFFNIAINLGNVLGYFIQNEISTRS